jgi:hypothetical protein
VLYYTHIHTLLSCDLRGPSDFVDRPCVVRTFKPQALTIKLPSHVDHELSFHPACIKATYLTTSRN